MKTFLKIFSIVILVFLGAGAFFGAFALISDPSGANFEWTPELLENTPFKDFLIPGIILLVANGLFPIIIALLIIKNNKYAANLMILQGLMLVIWLTAEILFNSELYSGLMHPMFYATGAMIILLGILQRKYFKAA